MIENAPLGITRPSRIEVQCRRDGPIDVLGIGDLTQIDEPGTIRKALQAVMRHFKREPRFPNATWAGQRWASQSQI